MNSKHLLFAVIAAAVCSLPSYSAIIFDNADAPLTTTTRTDSIEGVAAYLQIAGSDVNVGQIAINAQPLQNGQLKFVIFSDIAPPGNDAGTLLYSDTVNVSSSNTLSYVLSDPLSFTLQAGHFYDIGAVFSGTSIRYTYDLSSDAGNGITSVVNNENITGFANPALAGHGVSDISIQMYSSAAVTPEPSTFTLATFGFGFLGVAVFLRFRERTKTRGSAR